MAAVVKGAVAYKKKDGTLALTASQTEVTWTPAVTGAAQPLIIPIASITNLQATPATSANCMMKIFQSTPEGPVLEYKLSFTSPTNARGELEELKKALTVVIQAHKNPAPAGGAIPALGTPTPGVSVAGTPAALAIASALSGGRDTDVWSDARLQADSALQQDLLKHDADLGRTFFETVLKGSITAAQFWSTRTHLLRSYAIERNQVKGAYNVLSTMKPKTVDNAVRISLSREQIQDIFRQHPLVKRVYDENVPKISEGDFWRRFFSSRLFKKLKGEKILPGDGYDDIVDSYLNAGDEANSRKKQRVNAVPNFINLEGNEQHTSQAKGNRPDVTMRPERIENVPLIRTLNSISMKIVDSVNPIDKGFSEDRAMEELALSDLRGDAEVERIILNIQDQRRFFSQQEGNVMGDEIFKKDPGKVLRRLRNGLGSHGALDLAAAAVVASRKGGHIRSAMGQITQAISDRGCHFYDTATIAAVNSGSPPPDALNINLEDIPRPIHDALTLTHATTTEFLHHFWLAFLSGDEKRAADLQTLVGSLRRSGDRVEAVAKQAEEEKEKEKERRKQAALAEYKATGKKRRKGVDDNIPGGRKLVEEILGPTMKAVEFAVGKWEEAVREAERAQSGEGGGSLPE
ncbi:BSD-domain-containing protein [Terfezia boudieri ATCC MYA-4762]|uniref:BSD-domain-containing protein n=1 Tax=Terfezia boudieri ATCC MYA-4762 TaxID=1051890 RepID=A0A3N4LGF4_9PEZI|nr:BSD-domain-containing protein [Terfezia boudieri ATCC MYA-4762]